MQDVPILVTNLLALDLCPMDRMRGWRLRLPGDKKSRNTSAKKRSINAPADGDSGRPKSEVATDCGVPGVVRFSATEPTLAVLA
jgi:hypothetical protein